MSFFDHPITLKYYFVLDKYLECLKNSLHGSEEDTHLRKKKAIEFSDSIAFIFGYFYLVYKL